MANINLKSLVKESVLGDLPSSKVFKYNKKTGKYDSPRSINEKFKVKKLNHDEWTWEFEVKSERSPAVYKALNKIKGIEFSESGEGFFVMGNSIDGKTKAMKVLNSLGINESALGNLQSSKLFKYDKGTGKYNSPVSVNEAPMDIELQEDISDVLVLLGGISKKVKSYSPKAFGKIQSVMKLLMQAKKDIRNV